jgi:hypothetical protein
MVKILFFLLGSVLFLSCRQKNTKHPDVSHIKVDLTIQRFDNDFFDNTIPVAGHLAVLQKKYGKLFDYFLAKTFITDKMQMGAPADSVVGEFIRIHKPLYDSVQLQYKDLAWLEKDLKKGFQYFQYYFPGFKVPATFAIVDGFYAEDPKSYYGVEYGADTLLLSLQMFLGKDFSGYDPEIYFDYLRQRFQKSYITKNIFSAIINSKFKPVEPGSALIDYMIDAGKRIYLLDLFLPDMDDAIKLGYTKVQLEDCIDKEQLVWSNFLNANNLFNVEPSVIKEYVGENPFTKDFGTDSPGNIGAFAGWQIVKKYVKDHPGITPAVLMETENRRIYTDARYKPD